jgi:hypothetical protein
VLAIAQGVHWLPEAVVVEGRELAVRCKVEQWHLLPERAIAVVTIQLRWFEHEDPPVDPPAIILRLFLEALHDVSLIDLQSGYAKQVSSAHYDKQACAYDSYTYLQSRRFA